MTVGQVHLLPTRDQAHGSPEFASTHPTTPLPRRFSRLTLAARRPRVRSVAQHQDWKNSQNEYSIRRWPPQNRRSGGWAAPEAPRDLTPDEQALRDALRNKTQSSPTREPIGSTSASQSYIRKHDPASQSESQSRLPHQLRGRKHIRPSTVSPGVEKSATFQRFDALATWRCQSCGYRNDTSHKECRKCQVSRPLLRKTPSRTGPTAPATSGVPEIGWSNNSQIGHGSQGQRGWKCTNCGFENPSNSGYCASCESHRPQVIAQDDEVSRVKNWKHVRRRNTTSVEQQQKQRQERTSPAETGNPVETEAFLKIRTADTERKARIEQTKDGKFVGLSQNSASVASASSAGARSRGPDAPNSNLAPIAQDTSTSTSPEDGWVQWPPSTSKSQSNVGSGGSHNSTKSKSIDALDGWVYPVEMTTVPLPQAEIGHSFRTSTSDELDRQRSPQARSDISFDTDFLETSRSQRPQNAQGLRARDTEYRARGSGIEITSMPPPDKYGYRNRQKERKNKQFAYIDEQVEDEDSHAQRKAERKKRRERAKLASRAAAPPTPVYLPEFISVSNLAGVLRVRVEDFTRKMRDLGFEETNNDHVLDAETAGLVATEFNFEPIIERVEDRDLLPLHTKFDKSKLPPRPPVVTIMGHVDHGKTTLLDYLRKSSVAASEHGGITQHIGAFSVAMSGGKLITFLDTPGHEAFLSMRQRGANVTDIVILVVAADDSVKPQTVEAIKHAQAAKVPMIVAVNKIDKEDSNVERVKQDLARYGVEIEDFGGDTQTVCVSGKTGQGMDKLEDATVALADILDMRAGTDGQAEGWVLEATTKKAGRVATVLVRRGVLRPGNIIVAGTSWARVRSLRNEAGVMVRSAGPGTPVEIDGWREQPSAGDEVIQAPDEQKAKSVIEYRLEASQRTKLAADMDAVNESRRVEQEKREQLEQAAELAKSNPDAPITSSPDDNSTTPAFQEVFFIIKADVSGSVEAVTNSVSALGNSEIRPHILRTGVGAITEFDIDHAAVAKGHIISFNTVVEGQVQRLAEAKDVQIIDQSIIYKLVDDVRATLGQRLPSVVTQRVLGEAEIAQVFEINTKGRTRVPVAGCKVRNGVISRTAKIRVLRDKETVFDGEVPVPSTSLSNSGVPLLTLLLYLGSLTSLKNVKKDVTEMRKGNECGMAFEDWTTFQVGDQVQAYEESIEKRTL